MFNIFRKKTQIEQLIEKDGIDHATDRIAEIVSAKLNSREIAYQFILEEVEAASEGNSTSQKFASNSGIPLAAYKGAMKNSMPEVDGPDGPQMLLNHLTVQLKNSPDVMLDFRLKISDKIMRKFDIGRYGTTDNNEVGRDHRVRSDGWMNELISWAEKYELPKLQFFDAQDYRQTGFPRSKSEFAGLKYLHLPSCNIAELPTAVGYLKDLQAVCLDDNHLTELPREICNITSLLRLDLDGNPITMLPKEIGNLGNLHFLSLRNTPISDFPIEMLKLKKLNRLDLRGVKIHLGSKYSPLSHDGFKVHGHFSEIIREDNISSWLSETDTSKLKLSIYDQ